jgi:hypothetical protein
MLVEGAKAFFGECRGRTQFAGAERGQWPSRRLDVACDPGKTFGERQQFVEPDTLDLEAGAGGNAA